MEINVLLYTSCPRLLHLCFKGTSSNVLWNDRVMVITLEDESQEDPMFLCECVEASVAFRSVMIFGRGWILLGGHDRCDYLGCGREDDK